MKLLTGDTNSKRIIKFLQEHGWGRMFASRKPTPYPCEPWGFDNGAFKVWQDVEFHPNLTLDDWSILFNVTRFQMRLDVALHCGSDPIVAVVPDIPGSKFSLEYSLSWIKELPMWWPWYLAVQDGMKQEEVLKVLPLFAGIFLGGTDKFKLTAYRWARLAHCADKKFHYGRAGTLRKLQHAHSVEADSCDSTFPLWTQERMRIFRDHDLAIRSGEQAKLF